jgi:hypothetical protein
MSLALTLLIVAVAPLAANEGAAAEAVVVFRNGFEEDADLDFDTWPDGWTRRRGPGYPHYVRVRIAPDNAPTGGRALRIELDGGAAAVSSPPIPLDADYSYVLEGWVRTENLRRDAAALSLTLLDEQRRPLEVHRSAPLAGTAEWTRLRVGPVQAADARAVQVFVGLHLEPRNAAARDIRGVAAFDGLWLGRLPKLSLRAGEPPHLFADPADVEINCQVSGFSGSNPAVRFELLDALGNIVDRADHRLDADMVRPVTPGDNNAGNMRPGTATLNWRPALRDFGFFRARVTMLGHEPVALSRETTLAVLDPQPAPTRGEFGWTMPTAEGPFKLTNLPAMLGQMGVNWVKFPVWHAEADVQRSAALAAFDERLRARRIEMIGLLNDPPEDLRARFGHPTRLQAADIFVAAPDMWYPSLEPVLSGLSMKIHWWQLGTDGDISFVGNPQTPDTLRRVREQFEQLGPDVRLAVAWGWLNDVPRSNNPAWQALSLTADPALTSEELGDYLANPRDPSIRRWVTLQPLACDDYPPQTRAADLVRRIVAGKIHGADAMFVPDVLDPRHGLFHGDGSPAEMLLPWRTAALSLAGSEHLGSMHLDGGSVNHVFSRGRDAVMVVWSESPREESLFLGEDAVQSDVWGRRTPIPTRDGRQTIAVGPIPSFVSGINEPIIRMAMNAMFVRSQVPSVFGEVHSNALKFRNFFGVGASGRLRLIVPDGWVVRPDSIDFKLAAGEEAELPVELKFTYAASSGPQSVRLEFEMNADRPYRFDVTRTIEVGLGDVTLEAETRLNEAGELIVEQRITNHTEQPVSFKCDLSAPNHRLMRTQIWDLERGTDVQTYPLAAGRELIGQTIWIRAQEIHGSRVLSRRYIVRP